MFTSPEEALHEGVFLLHQLDELYDTLCIYRLQTETGLTVWVPFVDFRAYVSPHFAPFNTNAVFIWKRTPYLRLLNNVEAEHHPRPGNRQELYNFIGRYQAINRECELVRDTPKWQEFRSINPSLDGLQYV